MEFTCMKTINIYIYMEFSGPTKIPPVNLVDTFVHQIPTIVK